MSSGRFKLSKHHYEKLKTKVAERDNYCCVLCKMWGVSDWHHIDRRSSGGGDYLENIVLLCNFMGNNCHDQVDQYKKKIPEEVLENIGYYNNNQRRV